jgi:hypothetical protein
MADKPGRAVPAVKGSRGVFWGTNVPDSQLTPKAFSYQEEMDDFGLPRFSLGDIGIYGGKDLGKNPTTVSHELTHAAFFSMKHGENRPSSYDKRVYDFLWGPEDGTLSTNYGHNQHAFIQREQMDQYARLIDQKYTEELTPEQLEELEIVTPLLLGLAAQMIRDMGGIPWTLPEGARNEVKRMRMRLTPSVEKDKRGWMTRFVDHLEKVFRD